MPGESRAGFGKRPSLPRWCCPHSLQGKQIILTICLFAGFIWSLAFLSSTMLGEEIERVLSQEQLATARHVAHEIDLALWERTEGLAAASQQLPADLVPTALSRHLAQLHALHHLFPGGLAVVAADGRLIAEYPATPRRWEREFADQDFFREVLVAHEPRISKPMLGSLPEHTLLLIGVPVFDSPGKLRAIMVGITDLTAPNFLGRIADPSLPGDNEIMVASLRHRMVIASSDGNKSMMPTPAQGIDIMYDRFAKGFRGSEIAPDTEGIRRLYSSVTVPAADWLVVASQPAEEVLRPVTAMERYVYLVAAALTVLAALLIGWVTRRTLAPLEKARQALSRMTCGQEPLGPLPIVRDDEVGQLIDSFNRLADERQRHEAALARSEQRFRLLVESAPDAILVEAEGKLIYANLAAVRLFAANSKEELLGQLLFDRIHLEGGQSPEALGATQEAGKALPATDGVGYRMKGPPVQVEISAVAFRYEEKDGTLIFVRDVTERKQAIKAIRASEAKLTRSRQKLRDLSAHNESALEEERRYIAREIHDELGQLLTALKMDCSLLLRSYPDDAVLRKKIEDMRSLLDSTIGVARHVVSNLRPPALDHGITPAIEWLAEDFSLRWEIACNLHLDTDDIVLDDGCATSLFRIIQESLTNVARHAQASRVTIFLGRSDDRLLLRIQDDGQGFDPKEVARKRGFGLQSMRERAIARGGSLRILSAPGGGTSVIVSIPL